MMDRRRFLRMGAGALPALGVLSPLSLLPSAAGRSRAVETLGGGLFFSEASLPEMRRRYASDPLFAPLRADLEAIDVVGMRRFIEEEMDVSDHLLHQPRLYNIAHRLAFHYAMTGEEAAAEGSMAAARAMLRWPTWDYFMDGDDGVLGIQRASGNVVALSCAADWLGEALPDDERRAWLRVMGERGCEACYRSVRGMRFPDEARGWHIDPESAYLRHRPYDTALDLSNWPRILDRTNLKAVPASALAVGAVAYEKAFGRSETTDRWIEQAAFSVASFGDLYAPDGSYDEGLSYANYTSFHLIQATEVLRRHRGLDLTDAVNWPGFIDYAVGMSMPTRSAPYDVVRFGDVSAGLTSSVPYWVARRFGDARARWFGEQQTYADTEWSLMWHTPGPIDAAAEGPSVWASDLGWITARTGHGVDDLVVALRSGGPSNHEHADRGSLVVKAFGEVLVDDPYRPPYAAADPAWLLRTTAGHSAVLVDGQGHQYHDGSEGTNASDAHARLTRVIEREGYAYWTSDATPAYRLVLPHVTSVTRTVYVLFELPAVLVLDKVVTDGTPVRLQARFFAENRDEAAVVDASSGGFRIVRPHAHLHGGVYSAAGVEVQRHLPPIPSERARQHPFVQAQAERSAQPLLVTALLPNPAGAPPGQVRFTPTPDGVEAHLTRDGRSRTLRVLDTGTIPEVWP